MLIATRTLSLDLDGATRAVEVRLFAPVEHAGGGWSCLYEIDWPEGLRHGEGWGFDAMQAIHLTLQRIGTDLYVSEHHEAGGLYLQERGRGYGFPVPKNLRDLLIGDDARFDG